MNIFYFRNNEEWVNYTSPFDFDNIFNDIILEGCLFQFSDCTEDEIDEFLDNIDAESSGLDDVYYYRFCCDRSDSMTKNDIYIFNDLVLTTFDKLIESVKNRLKDLETLKEKI